MKVTLLVFKILSYSVATFAAVATGIGVFRMPTTSSELVVMADNIKRAELITNAIDCNIAHADSAIRHYNNALSIIRTEMKKEKMKSGGIDSVDLIITLPAGTPDSVINDIKRRSFLIKNR